MQKSVYNKNSTSPTTEQVKEWSGNTAKVITETVNIIKRDLSWVRRLSMSRVDIQAVGGALPLLTGRKLKTVSMNFLSFIVSVLVRI